MIKKAYQKYKIKNLFQLAVISYLELQLLLGYIAE